MSLKSKLIEKAMQEMAEELPERDPALVPRLTAPFTPEARDLLAVFRVLLAQPFAQGQFLPLLTRILEDTALLCEYNSEEGAAQRVWARDFLARLKTAVGA